MNLWSTSEVYWRKLRVVSHLLILFGLWEPVKPGCSCFGRRNPTFVQLLWSAYTNTYDKMNNATSQTNINKVWSDPRRSSRPPITVISISVLQVQQDVFICVSWCLVFRWHHTTLKPLIIGLELIWRFTCEWTGAELPGGVSLLSEAAFCQLTGTWSDSGLAAVPVRGRLSSL